MYTDKAQHAVFRPGQHTGWPPALSVLSTAQLCMPQMKLQHQSQFSCFKRHWSSFSFSHQYTERVGLVCQGHIAVEHLIVEKKDWKPVCLLMWSKPRVDVLRTNTDLFLSFPSQMSTRYFKNNPLSTVQRNLKLNTKSILRHINIAQVSFYRLPVLH